MVFLPLGPQFFVFLDVRLRDGVGKAEGYEVGASVLRPVRESFAARLVDFPVRMETCAVGQASRLRYSRSIGQASGLRI